MSAVENLTAAEVPYSSAVGKSVMLTAPGGAVVAQIAIMVPSVAHDYRETAEAVAARVVAAWNGRDRRSFPDAADGRPMPPMGDDLMVAGLSGQDARFVALQLAQNGLALAPAAPVSAGKVKALAEAAIRDCAAGAPISAANLARDVLAALQPGDGWQGIESAPKDGQTVLLHGLLHQPSIDAGTPETVMGYWTDHNGGGWVWHGSLAITFTHWMPRPAPPETGAAAQTGGEEDSGSSTRNAQDTHPGTDYTGTYGAEREVVSNSGEKSCPASLPQGEETR